MTEYAGRQFVGIDLHRRRSVVVRTSESGEVLEAVQILNDADRLNSVIARAGEPIRFAIGSLGAPGRLVFELDTLDAACPNRTVRLCALTTDAATCAASFAVEPVGGSATTCFWDGTSCRLCYGYSEVSGQCVNACVPPPDCSLAPARVLERNFIEGWK